jgi:polysaccharide biosynthesis/export protein
MHRIPASAALTLAALCSGCAGFLSSTGPTRAEVEQSAQAAKVIQIVDVDDAITRRLLEQRKDRLFSEVLGDAPAVTRKVGPGDVLEVSIWEAAPATLFGTNTLTDSRGAPSSSRAVAMPEQVVSVEGEISVPFAGRIRAAGRTLPEIEGEITSRLKGKANQAEVLVRLTRNSTSSATVVGEVNNSMRVPLTPANERLLDALAAAAGVRQPVNKTTIQIARKGSVHSLPMQTIINDPRQNIALAPGDVVTAYFQPLSFTALGATGKNQEINFESQGISLAQALARAGGLLDERSNPQGVFIFRFEPRAALDWPRKPVATTPEDMVPVIYRVDLKNPATLFVIQSFAMKDKDLLYISNAPIAELQKVLNIVFSVAYPVLTAVQVTQ